MNTTVSDNTGHIEVSQEYILTVGVSRGWPLMEVSEYLWDKLTLEQINQPMSMSCPCRKCSTYS